MKFEIGDSDINQTFHGTSMVYCIRRNEIHAVPSDYEITFDWESFPGQFRAARLEAKKKEKLPSQALGQGLMVVMGSDASPAYVVDALESMAKFIKKHGLQIGRATPEGDLQWEDVTGEIWPTG